VLGETYLPHPVLAQTPTGAWFTALCYIARSMDPGPPDAAYVERILQAVRQFKFRIGISGISSCSVTPNSAGVRTRERRTPLFEVRQPGEARLMMVRLLARGRVLGG